MKPLFHTHQQLTRDLEPMRESGREVLDIFKRLTKLKEDRAIVLVGALFVENAVDQLITSIIPDFSKVNKRKEITFSVKIDLAKALNMAPSSILNCADRIRDIRNEFAHNIELETFDDLDERHYDSLKAHLYKYLPNNAPEKKTIDNYSFYELFRDATENTVLNLLIYAWNINVLNEYIRTDEFMQNLIKYFKDKRSAKTQD